MRSAKLVLSGLSSVVVAERFGDSQTAVASWARRLKQGGEAGLRTRPRPGQPTKLTSRQIESVATFVRTSAAGGTKLTGSALARHIKRKFGVTFTVQHCLRMLAKFGD